MNSEIIKSRLAFIESQKEILRNEVKVYVSDKTIPLDERWKLFVDSGVGAEKPYIEHWQTLQAYSSDSKYRNDIDDNYIHDGESYHKHETICVESIYETLLDEIADSEDDGEGIDAYKNDLGKSFDHDGLNEWREEVLSKMIYSYKFDW